MLFYFNDTPTSEIYPLSLHDALPIFGTLRHCNIGLVFASIAQPAYRRSDPANRLLASLRMCSRKLPARAGEDRKSTRLNSSHVSISYAVFCLKKKKTNDTSHRFYTR